MKRSQVQCFGLGFCNGLKLVVDVGQRLLEVRVWGVEHVLEMFKASNALEAIGRSREFTALA